MSVDESPASDFKSGADNATVRATESERTPGDALAGCPGRKDDDCKPYYREQRHELFGASSDESTESSPSAGWRTVYDEMGVDIDANSQP